ncbi:septum formation protein [Fluviicoccus keumensis]|uniref:dTTP/UTP pyrophosphatase n=1 Tax=Fluviicoccus keumensis TaxID=1435465 RepID=A0A4Q7Z3I2_9GAMM|nr:Maf family protein [Fluviicoccus keumensis]RZU44922.1 septum formation protein [Fluviicoccus keumensis]
MLYLASTSPRRRELLQQIGLVFDVLKISVDESELDEESPAEYVARLAVAKAQSAQGMVGEQDLVLAADTTVVRDGVVIGKPATLEEAMAIWESLSGRSHQVMTGIAMARGELVTHRVVTTEVHFRPISRPEMEAYWQTGEPQDKAGGYGIQGRGAIWVDRIAGSYSNVVGLPLAETAEMLEAFGYSVWTMT